MTLTPSWTVGWNSTPTIRSKSPNSRKEGKPITELEELAADIVAADGSLFDFLHDRHSPDDGVSGDFDGNFLNLIVPQSAITNTFVNGSSITNLVAITNFMAITNSGYSAARVSVAAGTNYTISCPQPVEVQVYGFAGSLYTGFYDAYGYIGGITNFP